MKKKIFLIAAILLIVAAVLGGRLVLDTGDSETGDLMQPDAGGIPSCPGPDEACGFISERSPEDPRYSEELADYYRMHKGSRAIIELSFKPHLETCYGPFETQCLVEENGDYFYGSIDGFEFEEGYGYKLRVVRTQKYDLEDVPQDVGVYEYGLLEVLEKARQ